MKNSPTRPLTRRSSLAFGFTLPYQALRLATRSAPLAFWSLLPLLITTGLYFWALSAIQSWAHAAMIRNFLTWGWNPEGWMAGIILFISRILLILVGAFTFSISATIIASPFNDYLAELTESRAQPALPPAPSLSFSGKVRLLGIDIAKSMLSAFAAACAILFSWVPVLNLLIFAFTFLLMTFQYTSYPQTRRGIGIREGMQFLWRYFFSCLGFGASISILFSLPLISIFALPLAVIGGTLLVARAPGSDSLPSLR